MDEEITGGNYEPGMNDESSEEESALTRFDWKFVCTKQIVSILKRRKERKETFSKTYGRRWLMVS